MYWSFSRENQDNSSNLILSDASDSSGSTHCIEIPRIVTLRELGFDHVFCLNCGPIDLLHTFFSKTWRFVSRNIQCFLRKRLQTVIVFLWSLNGEPQSFIRRNDWWSSLLRCRDCCFFKDGLLSLVTWCLHFGWIRAGFLGCASFRNGEFGPFCSLLAQGFSWLWESSSHGAVRSASSATKCSKTSVWEGYWFKPLLMSTHEHSVAMVSRLPWWVVVLPNSSSKTNQRPHYHTKRIPILHLDCREEMCTLCIPVSNSLHALSKVWSPRNDLCQPLLRNLLLVIL